MRISDWSSDVCSSDLPFLFDDREAYLIAGHARGVAQGAEDQFGRLFVVGDDRLLDACVNGCFDGGAERSEERRVGKECVSQCRSGWSPYHEKTKWQDRKNETRQCNNSDHKSI